MKSNIVTAAVIAAFTAMSVAPAMAGGLGEPVIEDELIIVEEGPSGSLGPGVIVGGLLGLALIAAAVSSSDDT
jgi:hypothetical protein